MNGLDTRSYALRRVQGERIALPPRQILRIFTMNARWEAYDWNRSELSVSWKLFRVGQTTSWIDMEKRTTEGFEFGGIVFG